MQRIRTVVIVSATLALLGALLAPVAVAADRVDVIVVLDEGRAPRATAEATAAHHRMELRFVYEHSLQGFAGSIPRQRLNGLRSDPRVDYVEIDGPVTTASQVVPTGVERAFATENLAIPITGTPEGGGKVDATVAVLDTGIDAAHPDLDVVAAVDCMGHTGGPPHRREYVCVDGGDDGYGHGTHVAGTVAALDNDLGVAGVAPGASLWAVKVLDDRGSGSWSTVIAGIEHVTVNAGAIDVANMSLGGGQSQAVDDAISASVEAGVTYVLAAGNNSDDVANRGPAGHPRAITVAALADFDGEPGGLATTRCRTDAGGDDEWATFSNYGDGVDLIAPGVCIRSTYPGGGLATMSGTSMAAPHVAGAAALLASEGTTTPEGIAATLLERGNHGWSVATSPDYDETTGSVHYPLLDVSHSDFAPVLQDADGGTQDPTPAPPTVTITAPADGATVDGTVTLAATATSDDEIAVTFTVGGASLPASEGTDGAWTADWNTTGVADADHLITATVTDTFDQAGEDTITVAVDNSEPGTDPGDEPTGLHVSDLTGQSTSLGSTWRAVVTVTVADGGAPVAGVDVDFSYRSARGATGALTCTTGGDGTCPVDVELPKRDADVTVTVDSLTPTGSEPLIPDPKPTITVAKP